MELNLLAYGHGFLLLTFKTLILIFYCDYCCHFILLLLLIYSYKFEKIIYIAYFGIFVVTIVFPINFFVVTCVPLNIIVVFVIKTLSISSVLSPYSPLPLYMIVLKKIQRNDIKYMFYVIVVFISVLLTHHSCIYRSNRGFVVMVIKDFFEFEDESEIVDLSEFGSECEVI